jgi:Ser/Thr protein kinase RdoA (MazF antagonist)
MADPLAVIAAPPPPVDAPQAVEVARQHYGLTASARELVSERDRNFHLRAEDGRSFVLKIANAAEAPLVTDFQVRALLHIAARQADIAVPEIVPTRDGSHSFLLDTAAGPHVTRLVTWLDGVVMRSRPVTRALARHFGGYAARLGRALAGFEHPGADHSLLWDMRRAGRVRELTAYIGDEELRRLVADRLDRFLERQLPLFPALRSQVVHNDLNPENVLLAADDDSRVAGVIDFGDMVASPLVVDVAVAASYLRKFDGDPLDYIREFVAAYRVVTPLESQELELVVDLVRVRLAMTTAILHWRLAERGPDDPYLGGAAASESTAARFLARLDDVPGRTAGQPLL